MYRVEWLNDNGDTYVKGDLKQAKKHMNGLKNAILKNLLFQWCFMMETRNTCFI